MRLIYEESLYSPSEIYQEAAKLNASNIRKFRRRIERVLGQEFFLRRISQAYKMYPTCPRVALPSGAELVEPPLAKTLRETIVKRRSARAYSGEPLSVNDLSIVLRNGYGVTGKATLLHEIEQKLRAVPSGGALYPLEIYAACFNVDGIEPGLYHYNVQDESLECVRQGQFSAEFGRICFIEETFSKLPALVIISGILKRSSLKYSERAYRFMVLEAGHVGQNLCLSATALGLGSLMLGGYLDEEIDQILGVDGVQESVLYMAAVGGI
jgi:SagB-type dehydrogenase family enzyme